MCAYDAAFVQIHQSYIINMNYLLMVQGCQCVMYPPFNNVDELQVSKKYRKEMMERFSNCNKMFFDHIVAKNDGLVPNKKDLVDGEYF